MISHTINLLTVFMANYRNLHSEGYPALSTCNYNDLKFKGLSTAIHVFSSLPTTLHNSAPKNGVAIAEKIGHLFWLRVVEKWPT